MEFLSSKINYNFDDFIYADMKKMRYLYEYVADDTILDVRTFSELFMRSGIRELMDKWHGRYSNRDVPELLKDFMEAEEPALIPKTEDVGGIVASWIGMAYSFFCYYMSMSSKEVVELLDFDTMLRYFSIGHEMSFEGWANRVIREVNEYRESLAEVNDVH